MGARLRRVATRLSPSAYRKHQHPGMGDRLRKRGLDAQRGHCSNVYLGAETEAVATREP